MSSNKKDDAKKDSVKENVNAELSGMGIFGTTSNEEVAGYKTSGDLENAGQVEKGFKRPKDGAGATASVRGEDD